MEKRSNVIKSKSSNSAITTKSGLKESTRSHLHFQRNIIKKRGVYVEHKDTMTRIGGPETNTKQEKPIKPPPRPRPGRKKFLASVLTILSKTTESTQYPDDDENSAAHQTNIRRKIAKRRLESKTKEIVDTPKKMKYKSKILNNSVGKDKKDQQIIVLQEQKEIKNTSSIFSHNHSANFSNLSNLIKNAQHNDDRDDKQANNRNDTSSMITNSAMTKFLDGKQIKRDKRVRIEDPTTLVGVNHTGTQDATPKDNKGLYNFFVDLLETIDVYNVMDSDKAMTLSSSGSSTKVPLEINESIANKLAAKRDSPLSENKSRRSSPRNRFYCFKDDEKLSKTKQLIPETPINKEKSRNNRPKKAESFLVTTNPKVQHPKKLKANSFNIENKFSMSRKRKKNTLLNMFKEQLKMDAKEFVEPQNLYDALKIIAENKRKCQKTIHFEEKLKRSRADSDFPKCTLKCPKIIKNGRKRKTTKLDKEPVVKVVDKVYGKIVRRKETIPTDSVRSQYSLQVFGYNYKTPVNQTSTKAKEVVFTYHSTPSTSEADDSEYTDSFFNSFKRAPTFSNHDF